MVKSPMGQNRSNQKNFAGFAYSKSVTVYLILLLALVAGSCSSKKTRSGDNLEPKDLVHFDSLEGEVHQLTTQGENTEISFSPLFNKLLFVRNNPQFHRQPQIYIKNMIDKNERRLTYNLGENFHPRFHPFKAWIAYSSTSDEMIEKINVDPVMKDLGLKKAEQAVAGAALPLEVYVTNEDGSDIKRITHNKGYDSLAVFTRDGEKLVYVSQTGTKWQIWQHDLRNAQKRILLTSPEQIMSLSLGQDLLAYTTATRLFVKKLKNLTESVFESPDGFTFSDVELHPKDAKLLIVSNFEDKKNKDIYQIDIEKKCATRLTFHPGDESSPSFGPEGKSLFFVSNRSQTNQIYATLIREALPCKSW